MKYFNTRWIQVINATCPLLFNHGKLYSQRVDKKTCTIHTLTSFKGRAFLFASFLLTAVMFSSTVVKAQVTFTVTGSFGTQVYPGGHNPGNTGTYTCSPTFPIPNTGSTTVNGVLYHLDYVGLATNQSNNWDRYVWTASSNITSYTFPTTLFASSGGAASLLVKIYDPSGAIIPAANYTLSTLNACSSFTFVNFSTTEKQVYKNLPTSPIGSGFATFLKISSTVPFTKIEFRHGNLVVSNPPGLGAPVYLYANYSTGVLCSAGTTPPSVTPTTATNTCPTTTVNLGSLAVSSTTPSGASLIWSTHNTPTSAADTLTTAQKAAVSTAGKYYALYYDATNACYSPADSVTLTLTSCVPPFSASNPAAQTATTGAAKTGDAATELAPTGGVSPYIYSNGAGDAACVAPSGATLLTGLTVNSNGSYSYTAPTTAGTYYYCIKVCDSNTPTASCVVKTYTLSVSPNPLTASNPAAQTATTGAAKTGNAATELAPTGGVSPYIYSNGSGDAACVAPSGATLLTGLTVNSNGSYSYTAPTTAGTYYYCIKVCDSNTPTASCIVKTYTLSVSAPTPITVTNTCPTTTVNLTTAISATNMPNGATITWHTSTPATAANKVADPTAISTSGTYYLAFFDGIANCYSDASQPVTVTMTTCITPLTANNPPTQVAITGAIKTGNAATELAPSGGISPYIYSNGAGDAACVAPSGAAALTGLTVNADGSYSYTAPTTAGTYYYCIKVCDSTTPTAQCVMKTYTLTVTTAPTCTVTGIAPTFNKN